MFSKSTKERVLNSPALTDSGRRVAEQLMRDGGLVFERLFNHLGDLEDRLNRVETTHNTIRRALEQLND